MTETSQDLPPVVCTLSPDELSERGLEWADLRALATGVTRIDGGVASSYPAELHDSIADLADRENSCCGTWLQTNVMVDGSQVRLEVTTANPDGLQIILAMLGR